MLLHRQSTEAQDMVASEFSSLDVAQTATCRVAFDTYVGLCGQHRPFLGGSVVESCQVSHSHHNKAEVWTR
jgi:hypothetical protein